MKDWQFNQFDDIKDKWPKDADGNDDQAVLLTQTFDSPQNTDMMISLLNAYGIPCFKYYDLDGGAGKIINGFSGYGVSLYVPASRLEEANEILSADVVNEEDEE